MRAVRAMGKVNNILPIKWLGDVLGSEIIKKANSKREPFEAV